MDRRGFLRNSTVLAAFPALLAEPDHRMNVPPEVVDGFETITHRLTDGYAHAAIPITARAVRRELPIVHALLSEGVLTVDGRRRMHAVNGRLGALLANADLDTGWPGRAARRLAVADEHAELGEDATGRAWIRLLHSVIERQDGRHKEALAYARDGYTLAPVGSPVAARLAAEGIAFPLAAMGDRAGAAEALDAAWETLDELRPEQRGIPGWHPDNLTPAELDDISAGVYIRSGNPGAALVHTESGISRLDATTAAGSRAFVRINAANAMFDHGEAEAAFTYMRQALHISRRRKLAEIGDCAAEFLARGRERGLPRRLVDDLDDRLYEWRQSTVA